MENGGAVCQQPNTRTCNRQIKIIGMHKHNYLSAGQCSLNLGVARSVGEKKALLFFSFIHVGVIMSASVGANPPLHGA